jgi:hypothetical protein
MYCGYCSRLILIIKGLTYIATVSEGAKLYLTLPWKL